MSEANCLLKIIKYNLLFNTERKTADLNAQGHIGKLGHRVSARYHELGLKSAFVKPKTVKQACRETVAYESTSLQRAQSTESFFSSRLAASLLYTRIKVHDHESEWSG